MQEVNQSGLLRSSPESVSPRSPDGLRMSPVRATVPADARLRTKNVQNDYSFFLLLLGAHHSTIRPTDLRLSPQLQDAGIGAASRRVVRPMCRLAAARRPWSHGHVEDRTFQWRVALTREKAQGALELFRRKYETHTASSGFVSEQSSVQRGAGSTFSRSLRTRPRRLPSRPGPEIR